MPRENLLVKMLQDEDRRRGRRGALANSGPASMEVFTTPALGSALELDLVRALMLWDAWGEEADAPSRWNPGRPGELIRVAGIAARRALHLLSPGAAAPENPANEDPEARAKTALAALSLELHRRRTRPLVGIASHAPMKWPRPVHRDAAVDTRTLALTLAAYAVYSPPLLVWTRPVSLRWFRHDVVITLRRFDTRFVVPLGRRP